MSRRPNAPLGRTQRLVLQLIALSQRAPSARTLAFDWPGLTEPMVRGALSRLGDRGLVDAAGWEPAGGRTYCLTERGVAAERQVSELDPLDEEGAA